MYTIYGICIFLFSSSFVMVGYVLVRDIKNTRTQAANMLNSDEGSSQETEMSEEILAEYPQMKRTA